MAPPAQTIIIEDNVDDGGGHHHHHGGATGGESTGGDDVPSEPGTGSGAEPPVGGTGVDVTDAGVTYTASVGVGNPPSQYTLLIDTVELTT